MTDIPKLIVKGKSNIAPFENLTVEWYDIINNKVPKINWVQVHAIANYNNKIIVVSKTTAGHTLIHVPGGHIEKGEEPDACALREVSEECGIRGHLIVKPICPSYHTYSWEGISYLKKTSWFLMQYDGEMITKPQTSEGITKVQWLFPDELNLIKDNAWLSLMELINCSILR